MANDRTRERLTTELTPALLAIGLDLEHLDLTPAGRRRVLRVAVDKDGGVTLDDVAEATVEISRILDASDVMGELPYTLEVTSPGIDRPLTHARHWRRNAGRLVKVTLHDGESLTGRVVGHDEESAELVVDGTAPGVPARRVPFAEVAKAFVQIEFNRKEA